MLLLMVSLTVGLSSLFNILSVINVIPRRDGLYLAVLSFETLAFMVICGIRMRRMRLCLLREARRESEDAPQDNSDARKDNKTKEYYTRNLAACAIFALIVYMVRAVIGPAPYRILFAIINFANFFGFIHSVYVSIGIFFIMLVFTVFIAQAGVVSGIEKRSQGRQQHHDQRMEEAIKETERVRAENAGDVDVLGAVTKHRHHKR